MDKIIRAFLIELGWYAYTNKDSISVREFKAILIICSRLTTSQRYKIRLESFIDELSAIRNRDPTLQQRYLNYVTSYLVYKYFANH